MGSGEADQDESKPDLFYGWTARHIKRHSGSGITWDPVVDGGAQHEKRLRARSASIWADKCVAGGERVLGDLLAPGEHSGTAGTTFRSQAGATVDFARFLVILSTPHFFLDAASFH
jgi:hypothetical protein